MCRNCKDGCILECASVAVSEKFIFQKLSEVTVTLRVPCEKS